MPSRLFKRMRSSSHMRSYATTAPVSPASPLRVVNVVPRHGARCTRAMCITASAIRLHAQTALFAPTIATLYRPNVAPICVTRMKCITWLVSRGAYGGSPSSVHTRVVRASPRIRVHPPTPRVVRRCNARGVSSSVVLSGRSWSGLLRFRSSAARLALSFYRECESCVVLLVARCGEQLLRAPDGPGL